MKNAQAVATITGTAGWEALVKQKPVMVFGHNFYEYAPGVSLITTKEDAKESINNIINKTFIYDENKLKLFLQAVEDTAIKGHIDLLYKQVSQCTTEESVINISRYIHEFIDKNLC
jgi:capsule polysaccharide modification protein KpsS